MQLDFENFLPLADSDYDSDSDSDLDSDSKPSKQSPPSLDANRWYNKQDLALNASDAGDILVKWGMYHFTTFPDQDSFLDFIDECDPSDRCFFEVLKAENPQLMFADLDGEGLSITRETMYDQWEKLMKQVFADVKLDFNPDHVRLLDCTGAKISGHWSYNPSYGRQGFRNSEEQKKFWKYVEHVIERDYPDLCFLRTRVDGKMELMTVLDIGVYSRNRAMRAIYCHKKDSDRTLFPAKIRKSKIKPLSRVNALDYLIYAPSATDFYDLSIPAFVSSKSTMLTREQIEALILKYVPDVKVTEVCGRMFILKNTGVRTCIMNGEENESDNCYVIWRRDGLYFGCHDSDCIGQTKKIHSFSNSQVASDGAKLNIEYFHRMASECTTVESRKELINSLVLWMNEKYCLVKANKTFILEEFQDIDENDKICRGIKYKDIKSFELDFLNKTLTTNLPPEEAKKLDLPKPNLISPSSIWLKHRSRAEVEKIIFDPRMFFEQPSYRTRYYNLFDGFQITRDDVSRVNIDPEGFEDHAFFVHIKERLCNGNEEAYNAVLNIFAHILQKPWEKLQMSLVLQSTERTGKGIVFQIIKDIIGAKYFFQPSNPNQVLGQFNGQMLNCLICFMDEMVWGGDKERAGTLKKLVTESTNYVNEKYTPTIKAKNLANVFMASNEDWVVPSGATEQRWLVLNVNDELATCPKPKKRQIVGDILSIDRKKLAKFLYERDLSEFNHRETINTTGLRHQKIQSMSPLRKWWLSCLDKGYIADSDDQQIGQFGSEIAKNIMYNAASQQMKDRHSSCTKFWIEMKKIFGKDFANRRKMKNGERRRYIIIPSLDVARKRWCRLYNDSGWEWGEDLDMDSDSDSDSDFD